MNPYSDDFKLKYAEKLAEFVKNENIADLVVWTSQFKRTIQTAAKIQAPKEHWKALNEIDAVIILYIIFTLNIGLCLTKNHFQGNMRMYDL